MPVEGGLTVEPLGQGHIFRTQMRVKNGNKTVLTTYPETDGEVSEAGSGEIFKSGSVRGSSNLGDITSKKGALWALLDIVGRLYRWIHLKTPLNIEHVL
uniref:Uncharacterized protein n=1 Tax=Candidatus Methanogaster sp. ANME-2c ERB4 TaxID=2759911 RepID=A0A7G9YR39_9EURY|nr:hypothetical protein EGLMOMJH_00012 [Methanosarcinales archaeon ANME-2c ERB4]